MTENRKKLKQQNKLILTLDLLVSWEGVRIRTVSGPNGKSIRGVFVLSTACQMIESLVLQDPEWAGWALPFNRDENKYCLQFVKCFLSESGLTTGSHFAHRSLTALQADDGGDTMTQDARNKLLLRNSFFHNSFQLVREQFLKGGLLVTADSDKTVKNEELVILSALKPGFGQLVAGAAMTNMSIWVTSSGLFYLLKFAPIVPHKMLLLHGYPRHRMVFPSSVTGSDLASMGGNTMHIPVVALATLMTLLLIDWNLPAAHRSGDASMCSAVVQPVLTICPGVKLKVKEGLPEATLRTRFCLPRTTGVAAKRKKGFRTPKRKTAKIVLKQGRFKKKFLQGTRWGR